MTDDTKLIFSFLCSGRMSIPLSKNHWHITYVTFAGPSAQRDESKRTGFNSVTGVSIFHFICFLFFVYIFDY